MYISKVIVENFRNLNEFEIELKDGLNVILGENNVGKSNLIDAIRIALNSFYDSIEPIKLSKEDVYKDEGGKQDFSKPIKISLEFSEINTIDLQAEFQSILDGNIDLESQTAKISFSWLWSESTQRYSRVWSGGIGDTLIDSDIFQALPVTFLGALRDALRHISPGRKNYFSELFTEFLYNEDEKIELEAKIQEANSKIAESDLVKRVETSLNNNLEKICGNKSYKQETNIEASEAEFEQIIKNLKISLKGNVKDITSNGLGYNNLICIAVILAKLRKLLENPENPQMPLLLIEEPEAHLHPQLQALLTERLETNCTNDKKEKVQTIVTSHSAIIASQVEPELIHIMHNKSDKETYCFSLHKFKPEESQFQTKAAFRDAMIEWNKLRRIIDVTRATMFFAKGIILVEGITEAMLIPVLAKKMNKDLKQKGISVIPCGIAFNQIAELFKEGQLEIPVSIITDADPDIVDSQGNKAQETTPVKEKLPEGFPSNISKSDLLKKLETTYGNNNIVKICPSKVTLEYDIAYANKDDLGLILEVWKNLHRDKAKILKEVLDNETNPDMKPVHVWRDVCLCQTGKKSKANFSHNLTDKLEENVSGTFKVPLYIQNAIKHVIKEVK